MMNPKHRGMALLLVSVCLAMVLPVSCSDNPGAARSDGSVSHDGTNMTVKLSAPSTIAALAISNLQAEVTIDGTGTHPLDVDPITNAVSGTVAGVAAGTHDLQVTYFVVISGEDVILCTFTAQVTVTAGQSTSVPIPDEMLDRNHDKDNDGYTNLAEVRLGTDPLSPYDYPGGGSPLVICGNGTIQTASSENYTIKQVVGSAVAGTAVSDNYEVLVPFIGYE
jgi:hypothetical protein